MEISLLDSESESALVEGIVHNGRLWKWHLHYRVKAHLPMLQTVDLLFLSET